MNTNKNSYTIIYAAVLVGVVSTILALLSMGLKDRQQTNINVEKQLNILKSAGRANEVSDAKDKNSYVQSEFAKDIVSALVVNAKGEVVKEDDSDLVNSEAFTISPAEQFDIMRKIDGADETAKEALLSSLRLPVFICRAEGKVYLILSCYGSGLWGPIWGYLAVNEDSRTLGGALFDHKSETPGLGGEIVTDKFRGQFIDKIIYDGQQPTPIKVVKGGAKDKNHEIDALSGATITSTAVEAMISKWLGFYEPYLNGCRQAEAEVAVADTTSTPAEEIKVVND